MIRAAGHLREFLQAGDGHRAGAVVDATEPAAPIRPSRSKQHECPRQRYRAINAQSRTRQELLRKRFGHLDSHRDLVCGKTTTRWAGKKGPLGCVRDATSDGNQQAPALHGTDRVVRACAPRYTSIV
jgi:hypothetical protein